MELARNILNATSVSACTTVANQDYHKAAATSEKTLIDVLGITTKVM